MENRDIVMGVGIGIVSGVVAGALIADATGLVVNVTPSTILGLLILMPVAIFILILVNGIPPIFKNKKSSKRKDSKST